MHMEQPRLMEAGQERPIRGRCLRISAGEEERGHLTCDQQNGRMPTGVKGGGKKRRRVTKGKHSVTM